MARAEAAVLIVITLRSRWPGAAESGKAANAVLAGCVGEATIRVCRAPRVALLNAAMTAGSSDEASPDAAVRVSQAGDRTILLRRHKAARAALARYVALILAAVLIPRTAGFGEPDAAKKAGRACFTRAGAAVAVIQATARPVSAVECREAACSAFAERAVVGLAAVYVLGTHGVA